MYKRQDVKGSFLKQANGKYSENEFEPDDHFTLYKGEVASRFEEKNGKVVSAKYLSEDRKDVVVVNVEGLYVNNRFKDYDYILEVKDFTDISSLRNKMYRYYVDFSVSAKGSDFVIVEPVKVYEDIRRGEVVATEITLTFTERMYVDRELAENPTNYIFTRSANGKQYDVKDLGGKVESQSNGNQVVITLPEWEASDFTQFEVLNNIKDKDGVRLSGPRVYDFATKQLLGVSVKEPDTLGVKVTPNTNNTLGKDSSEEEAAIYSFKVTKGATTAANVEVTVEGQSKVDIALTGNETPEVVAYKIAQGTYTDANAKVDATDSTKVVFTKGTKGLDENFKVTVNVTTTGIEVAEGKLDNAGKDAYAGEKAEYGFTVTAANRAGKIKVTFTQNDTVITKVIDIVDTKLAANDVATTIANAFTGDATATSNEVKFTANAVGAYKVFKVTVEEVK